MPELPSPDPLAEDAYITSWEQSDDGEGLVEAITHAIEARRPQLAAQLVGLLSDDIEHEPGDAVDRARRAAHLVLFKRRDASQDAFDELEDAWRRLRRRRMWRFRRRQRQSTGGREPRRPRGGRRRR